MHITRLQAENFKKLVAIDIVPGTGAGIVPIRGKNAQGKSSTLDAIQAALGGKSVMPSRPVRAGEDQGAIRLEIDGGQLVVRRTFDADGGGQIIVENAEGFRPGSPQKLLDGLYASVAFDPLAFTRLKPEEQYAVIRKLITLEIDPEALNKITKSEYDERRDVNRDLKQAESVLSNMPGQYDVPAEKLDEGFLSSKIADASEHNISIERRRANRERFFEKHDQNKADLATIEAEIADLQKRAEEFRTIIADEASQIENAPALPEPIDVVEVQKELEDLRRTNGQIAANAQRKAQQLLVDGLKAKAEDLTKRMDSRNQQIADAFANAEMPVPGLSFGDGDVLLNGLPLEQASSAEQLRLSTAIGMAGNPKLRVMLVRDGSLLDEEGEQILASMAEENGFQLWLEAVDSSGKVGIVLEDGAVKDATPPETILPKKRAKKEQNAGEALQGEVGQGEDSGPGNASSPELDPDRLREDRDERRELAKEEPKREAFAGSLFDDED